MTKKVIFLVVGLLVSFITIQAQDWIQKGQNINGEAEGDRFGTSVCLSSDGLTLAVGARTNDGNGSASGHVRIYQYENEIWTQIGTDIDGEAAGDQSGLSVSLNSDGSIVAIGAFMNSDNGFFAGHARIFQNQNGVWTQIGQDIDGEFPNDLFGGRLSLSADGLTVAIGANGNDGNGSGSGHVRIYQYENEIWSQIGPDIDGEATEDGSGISVSLSSNGSLVAIGAGGNDGNGSNSGHVRIYQFLNEEWLQIGQDIDGVAIGDEFGYSVNLSSDGTIIAIGGKMNDGNGLNSGHVRIYQFLNEEWLQIGQDIYGEAPGDQFGTWVDLNSNGSVVAIGSHYNDNNGSNSGKVCIYSYQNEIWAQVGQDINGVAENDEAYPVSLNSDGSIVVIGAPLNDENGTDAGQIRVFDFPEPYIESQPENLNNICPESNVSFSISGNNIDNYQWQVNNGDGFINIENGDLYYNSNTATLVITGVMVNFVIN